jgi:hypothetical protein
MSRSKRVQVLMEPEAFARLEHLASQQGVAVAVLIRQAISERFFAADRQRQSAAMRVNSMAIDPLPGGSGPDAAADDLASRITLGRTEGLR